MESYRSIAGRPVGSLGRIHHAEAKPEAATRLTLLTTISYHMHSFALMNEINRSLYC
jgi:hypothetical protein